MSVRKRLGLLGEDGHGSVVVDTGEVEFLIGIEVHGLGEHTKLHRLQVFRTLGNDHDVGTALSVETLAQTSRRQQLVVDDQPVIVNQQNVDAGLDIAVLIGVIEKDNVDIVSLLVMRQPVHALTAVLVYSDIDIGEFLFHLVRLISDFACRRLVISEYIAFTLALIATREHADLHHIFE